MEKDEFYNLINTDRFNDMSFSSKSLLFNFYFVSDKSRCVKEVKSLIRKFDNKTEDLQELIDNGFVISNAIVQDASKISELSIVKNIEFLKMLGNR